MIDFENQIYTKVATALRSAYSGINCTSRTTFMPEAFPAVCLEEIDSTSWKPTRDTGSNENHCEVTFEANVYSNLVSGAKAQAKAIFSTLDGIMEGMGFTRTLKQPITVNSEPITYRMVGRYVAIIGTDGTIYRR